MTATSPLLEVRGVSKSFAGMPALADVSLVVERGELFALLGASGCGKTTLLRLVAGLEFPDRGQVLIDGVDVTAMPAYERPVNTMFQSYALFPHLNVEDNVAFGLKRARMPKPAIRERVTEMLELTRMTPYARRRPHELSGGQRQRAALARSLARLPKLLLLDEPLAALDKKLREQTQLELLRIQSRLGIAFVVVTHDQDEALALSQRLAVMRAGSVLQIGTPAQIYERPNSRYVADFVGRANIWPGRVRGREGGLVTVALAEAMGEVRVAHDGDLTVGMEVWIALRPERIAPGPGEPTANRVQGRIRAVTYQGERLICFVDLPRGGTIELAIANLGTGGSPRPGEPIECHWPPASGIVLTR